jgi:hypothetical protein
VLAIFAVIILFPKIIVLTLLTGIISRLLSKELAVTVELAVISPGSGNRFILPTVICVLAQIVKFEVI